jgi:hypothetical protein
VSVDRGRDQEIWNEQVILIKRPASSSFAHSTRRAKSAASASIARAAVVSNDDQSQDDGSDSEPYASPGPGVRLPGVPKIYDFKFIDKISPGEDAIRAAQRRCIEVERKYGLSETWIVSLFVFANSSCLVI